MKKVEEKKEIQSRREFFKNAAKAALPILGVALLASNPIIAKANETAMDCNIGCISGCYGGCRGTCDTSCGQGNCKGACDSSCFSYCRGTCKGVCRDNCSTHVR